MNATTDRHPAATRRHHDALWYAFGMEDARRETNPGEVIDCFGFAEFARAEADRYHSQECVSLDSVQGQWKRWIARHDARNANDPTL